jgi:hypothetical protein
MTYWLDFWCGFWCYVLDRDRFDEIAKRPQAQVLEFRRKA